MAVRRAMLGATGDGHEVSLADARRIAVRAQLLDGARESVLDTVRRLGFLQLDPIAPVLPAHELVLWSRHGSFDRGELDRLLWHERTLFEWNAFVWPIETLPAVRALMRRWRRSTRYSHERRARAFLAENAAFRRYVLREIDRDGPKLSRELEDRAAGARAPHRWYGSRRVGIMLDVLHLYGELAIVGRRGGQKLWDRAERWYPETDTLSLDQAERHLADAAYRAQGVRLERGRWLAHPEVARDPVPDRAVVLSPFDRLVYDRDRAEALWGFRYRLEMFVPAARREYGYYVLPLLVGDRLVGRAEPVHDRKAGVLRLLGRWGDTERLEEALLPLAAFLGAELQTEA
ncbi:MAG: DNA glycosylase AlkZ-like family protein [Gaiella sp.]